MKRDIVNILKISGLGERVSIKELAISDIPWLINEVKRYEFNQYLDSKYNEFKDIVGSEEIATENLNSIFVTIALRKNDNLNQRRYIIHSKFNNDIRIGTIALTEVAKGTYNLAYYIRKEYQHKGIGYESLKLFIDNLQKDVKLICEIQIVNNQSIRLAEKLGFELEKRVKGKYYDNLIYSRRD